MSSGETTFGGGLRRARLDAGLTQSQLVRLSGIPKPTLSRYENNHVMPSLQTLGRLADALNLAEGALLPGRTSPKEQLFSALLQRGIEIRSTDDAERIADLVAGAINDSESLPG